MKKVLSRVLILVMALGIMSNGIIDNAIAKEFYTDINIGCSAEDNELVSQIRTSTNYLSLDAVLTSNIIDFEDNNPMLSITCMTGDYVSDSNFPDVLTGVIEIQNVEQIEFNQVRPSSFSPYNAPDNIEQLYSDGQRVVYSYTKKDGSKVYRIYGEIQGLGSGWFECDDTGADIKGYIQEVDVTWDLSEINTAEAGTYFATAHSENYIMTCPAPKAKISVESKSGDYTIASHSIKWLSGSDTTIINENMLTIEPTTNRMDASSVTCQINFSMGGEGLIPAGRIEIRLPAHIFSDRDGMPVGNVNIPLAKAPQTGGNTGFHYYIDEDKDEIVIKNYTEILSSYVFMCQIQYGFTPFAVQNDFQNNNIKAIYQVELQNGNVISAKSEELSVKVNTNVYFSGNKKLFELKYETWHDAWGDKPDDADEYVYIVWRLYSKVLPKTTQPYDLFFEEQDDRGEVLGWSYNRNLSNFNPCNTAQFNSTKVVSRDDKYKYTSDAIQTRFVLMRYPRNTLEENPVINNKAQISLIGMDGSTKLQTVNASYTYVPVNMDYPGDRLSITKNIGPKATLNLKGALNILENGLNIGSSKNCYSLSISNRRWKLSNNGTDEYTTVIEDDFMYYGDQLCEEDYSFTGFNIDSFYEYDHVLDDEAGYKSIPADIDSYHPINVFIKEKENDDWRKIGEYHKGNSSSKWIPVSGKSIKFGSDTMISLPENTCAVRFEHTGKQYEVAFNVSLYYQLNSTEKVVDVGKERNSSSLYNYCSAYTIDKNGIIYGDGPRSFINSYFKELFNKRDNERYGTPVAHAYASQILLRFANKSSMAKRVSKQPQSDTAISCDYVGYQMIAYELVDFDGSGLTKSEVIESEVLKEQREGIFYDLLPAGTTLRSVNAKTYGMSTVTQKTCRYSLETIENWRNSGRTMLIIHVYAPESFINFDVYNNQLFTGFMVDIDIVNPWDNIKDNGAEALNSAAYYSITGSLGNGFADNGGNLKDKQWFWDLDNDGNLDESAKNVMYAQATTKFNPLVADELGFKKSVKALGDLTFNSEAKVYASGTYTYQLRFANGESSYANNVVMFDVLENTCQSDQYWQGTLKSVDVSQALKAGIDAKVYYSVSDAFTNLTTNTEYTDLTNESLWSITPPDNLSDVTAIAVDLSRKTDGSEYVFEPYQSVVCYVNMTAPSDYEQYMDQVGTEQNESVYAYNSAYLQKTTTPLAGGSISTSVDECSAVKVSLKGPMVSIQKESEPVPGTQDEPAIVSINETIKYHVYASNLDHAEAVNQLVIEDLIPKGLNIDTENILYYFGDAVTSAAPISGYSRVTLIQEGQKLVFNVDKLASGETIHLIIPCEVSTSAASGKTFTNIAKVTKFNDECWNIESEKICHKTMKVSTSVTVKKQWEDGDNVYGKRPESVIVQLCADGIPIDDKIATLSEDNEWKFTFDDLDKFRSDGETEIVYTALEKSSVPGYTTTYIDDNLTILNTANTHEENGSVTFKVKKYRTGTTIPVAGAVFVLKDGEKIVASSVTDDKGVAVFNYVPESDSTHDFTLSEESAPEGYIACTEIWSVHLSKGGQAEISIDTDQNLIHVIWNWIIGIMGNNSDTGNYKDGVLTVYNDYIDQTETPEHPIGGTEIKDIDKNDIKSVPKPFFQEEYGFVPKTGDITHINFWIFVSVCSAVFLMCILILFKKKVYKNEENKDKTS